MRVSSPAAGIPTASAPSTSRERPLVAVLYWELRRIVANRATWFMALGAFVIFCCLEGLVFTVSPYTIASAQGPRTFLLAWMSNFGLATTLPQTPGMYLGLLIPFLNADGAARDVQRRTHELLMTTAIPSRAYLWGRYLAGLALSLGFALVLWCSLLVMAVVKHQAQPTIVPIPDVLGMTALWALMVVPPTVLLSGVSFCLGTLAPRLAMLVKVGLMLGWFTAGNVVGRVTATTGGSLHGAVWDPTSLALAFAQTTPAFLQHLAEVTQNLSDAAFRERLNAIEQHLPDMQSWLLPHLFWCGMGLGFVGLIPLTFQRFRTSNR